jgi:hypothetical protein
VKISAKKVDELTAKLKKGIPGQALRAAGGWGSQISRQSAHEGGKFVSPTHWPPLSPRKYFWYSFLLEAKSTPVRPEGFCQSKIQMTPSGIESATCRLVAQRLHQLRHRVPPSPELNAPGEKCALKSCITCRKKSLGVYSRVVTNQKYTLPSFSLKTWRGDIRGGSGKLR